MTAYTDALARLKRCPRWRTKSGLVVVEMGRRRDRRGVKVAAYRADTGGWHGWLHLRNLTRSKA